MGRELLTEHPHLLGAGAMVLLTVVATLGPRALRRLYYAARAWRWSRRVGRGQ